MREKPKTLEKGESTYRNGVDNMCGGVISKSTFDSNPMAYMMAYYMDDEDFEEYKKITDEKKRYSFFKEYARSAI